MSQSGGLCVFAAHFYFCNLYLSVLSIWNAFLFLVVLWVFAAHVLSNWWRCFLNLRVFFLFACVFHLQHIELSRPLYKPAGLTSKTSKASTKRWLTSEERSRSPTCTDPPPDLLTEPLYWRRETEGQFCITQASQSWSEDGLEDLTCTPDISTCPAHSSALDRTPGQSTAREH